jgi:hypothetical protein
VSYNWDVTNSLTDQSSKVCLRYVFSLFATISRYSDLIMMDIFERGTATAAPPHERTVETTGALGLAILMTFSWKGKTMFQGSWAEAPWKGG